MYEIQKININQTAESANPKHLYAGLLWIKLRMQAWFTLKEKVSNKNTTS